MPSEPIVVEGPNATVRRDSLAQMVQLCRTLRDMILSCHLADQEGSESLVIKCMNTIPQLARGGLISDDPPIMATLFNQTQLKDKTVTRGRLVGRAYIYVKQCSHSMRLSRI